MTFQSQGLCTQDDHAYSAPDMQSCTQSSPHNPSLHYTSSQTCGHDQKSRPQQVYKELPEPQWVPSPQIQHRMPQSMQAIVGPQHCASVAMTFFLKHKQFNPTNDPVTTHVIVDDQGSLAYTVDRKRTSLKTNRVLRDAAGHPICTMRLQVTKGRKKWSIYKGAFADASSHVADVSRIYYTTRPGVQVTLAEGSQAEYMLRYRSLFTGRKQLDVMHHDQVVGRCVVKRRRLQNEGFLGGLKYCFELNLDAGYDHALLLCMIVILDHFYNH